MSRRLNRRIDTFQERMDSDAYTFIAEGLSPRRAREVVDAGGEFQWQKLSTEELDTLVPEDQPVAGTNVLWRDLFKREVDRIAEGEDPAKVVRGIPL